MKKRIWIFIAALAVIALLYFFTGKKIESPTKSTTLIVGTNAEYPPYTFINENYEIVGFDVDIAQEVAKRMSKIIEIKDRSFDMLIPEAQNGFIHVIAAGMAPTAERAEHILFTKPYLKGEPNVIVTLKKNKINGINDLRNKTVIVNEGFVADTYITSIADGKNINVKRLPAAAESLLDLNTEKSFAYVTLMSATKPYLEKFGIDNYNIVTLPDVAENMAMGVSKKYPELLAIIQPILDGMEIDGTIDSLKKKWKI